MPVRDQRVNADHGNADGVDATERRENENPPPTSGEESKEASEALFGVIKIQRT